MIPLLLPRHTLRDVPNLLPLLLLLLLLTPLQDPAEPSRPPVHVEGDVQL
jgi:hypothetical protein